MSADRLAPAASTDFAPPVYVRRMVGILTSMAIAVCAPRSVVRRLRRGTSSERSGVMLRITPQRAVIVPSSGNDLDGLLGDDAVDDPKRPEFDGFGVARGDEDVVGVRLGGVG